MAAGALARRNARLRETVETGVREIERRDAEWSAALERSRLAARALPDGVIILEGDRIEWSNDTARLQLGVEVPRDEGTPIAHLVRDPGFLAYLERGTYDAPVEVQAPAARGPVLALQVVEYGEGRRLVLSRDISHLRRLEQVGREFVANVSHELRTPLTVITGFLETLRDEQDPQAARRYVELMEEQARRMQRLVEDLLMLSSLESSPPPADDPIDMASFVERLAADARTLSKGRHRIEASAEDGLDMSGSERELASAFSNLVSNAIRYTPPGGTVRLTWHATADGADFDVEDTGIGIAAEHIPRLTERSYRVDRGRSRESGGTGLGLAIVKHALGRHGATLDVGSSPGKGSRFSARFPRSRLRRTQPKRPVM